MLFTTAQFHKVMLVAWRYERSRVVTSQHRGCVCVCVCSKLLQLCVFWGAVGQRGRRLERGWSFYDALSC